MREASPILTDAVDDLDDEYLTPAQVGGLAIFRKADGSATSDKSVYRWMGPAGCRGVVLGSVTTPSGARIPRREVIRFIDELGKADGSPRPQPRTATAKRRHHRAVDRELDEAGIA